MTYRKAMLSALDARIGALLTRQITDQGDPRFGGFYTPELHVEPRESGFFLSELMMGFITKDSAWYKSAPVERALRAALAYMKAHQRPDGCFDLSYCNFASPPDTAFMLNAVLSGYWLLDKCGLPEADFLRSPLRALMISAADGIAKGGFHTPNHRWAIAACLLSVYNITGNQALKQRAEAFLREGLDINADGEFAERSAGNYNQVNDDQMLRLYMATGESRFLIAAERNLEMMQCYFDPDFSVFTNNSTRQDMGKKVYADTYFILYLLTGYFAKKPAFAAMAARIFENCRARGTTPPGVEWLLLLPDIDDFTADAECPDPTLSYRRLFPDSAIARVRRGAWSYTLLKGKPNFLYFQHGAFSVYMTVYANLCDKRNFTADTMEMTDNGFVMTAHAEGWYYLPFKTPPATSDWWAMDNARTREKTQGLPLDTRVEVTETQDGIDVHLSTSGIDGLPLRAELAFLPGGLVRTEHFVQEARAGNSVYVADGRVQAVSERGEAIDVFPAFCKHCVGARMGGAYPLSENHFTVFLTDYTPVSRVISIRASRPNMKL